MPRRSSRFELYGHDLQEHATESTITAVMQIRGYRCTKLREAIGKLFDEKTKAITLQELTANTNTTSTSVHRVLKVLEKENLIHLISNLKAYIRCTKPIRVEVIEKNRCHSFAVCEKCHRVREFIHKKHSHPKVQGFKRFHSKHEWSGLCFSCYIESTQTSQA